MELPKIDAASRQGLRDDIARLNLGRLPQHLYGNLISSISYHDHLVRLVHEEVHLSLWEESSTPLFLVRRLFPKESRKGRFIMVQSSSDL